MGVASVVAASSDAMINVGLYMVYMYVRENAVYWF